MYHMCHNVRYLTFNRVSLSGICNIYIHMPYLNPEYASWFKKFSLRFAQTDTKLTKLEDLDGRQATSHY